jgi:LCP family protein required for cell wall assembly
MRALAIGLILIVIASVSGFYLYARVINGLFTRTNVNLQTASGDALNILLVGSDSRAGLNSPADIARYGSDTSVSGQRADSIMLMQIIPKQQRGVLLSFPRDLWVTIHDGQHFFHSKINAAYSYGPQTMIDTVSAFTGVPINHFMEINFAGFRRMVDAIGGIDICMNERIYDSQLLFGLPKGNSHLDGIAALNFVRMRHATAGGDFDRIKRQQQFLRAVMTKIGRPSVLGNPVRVNGLARAFAQNVKVDQYFQLDDMVRFALSVRRVGLNQLETYSVPGDVGNIGGASVVLADQYRAQPLFNALKNQQDPRALFPTPAPAPVRHTTTTTATHTTSAAPAATCPPGST